MAWTTNPWSPTTKTGRMVSLVVAAENSSAIAKAQADLVCDGTDDQDEIQEAIEDLAAKSGRVHLLAGDYNISSDIIQYAGISLTGEMAGWPTLGGTLLIAQPGITNAVIDVIPNPYTSVPYFPYLADIGIHGLADVVSVRAGLDGTGEIYDMFVNHVLVLGGKYGFELYGKIYVRDCYAELCVTGIKTTGNLISIDSCYIFGCTDYGIEFSRGNVLNSGVIKILNNTIRSNKKNNIRLFSAASDLMISNNFIGTAGVSGATADDLYFYNVQRAIVTNNKFTAGAYSKNAIRIENSNTRDSFIANNLFCGYSQAIRNLNNVRLAGRGMRMYDGHIEHFQNCLALSTTHVHAAITGNGAEQEVTTAITDPDVARNISITNSANSTGIVEVEGIDALGNYVSEDITIITGGTAYGSVAFATVTKITIPATVANPDTISIGISDKLGLNNIIYETNDVYKRKVDTVGVTIGTLDYVNCTVDCATINAGDDITIYYRSSLNVMC